LRGFLAGFFFLVGRRFLAAGFLATLASLLIAGLRGALEVAALPAAKRGVVKKERVRSWGRKVVSKTVGRAEERVGGMILVARRGVRRENIVVDGPQSCADAGLERLRPCDDEV
jgi:hypothetical protein